VIKDAATTPQRTNGDAGISAMGHTGPVRVTSLFLADHAEAVGGKLYVTGGGWDTIRASGFPTVHPHLSVCVALEVGWEDMDRPIDVRVVLLDADGRSTLPSAVGGRAEARRAEHMGPGDTAPLLLVFNLLGLRFANPGSFTVSVELDSEPVAQIPLKLVQVPKPGNPT